MGITAAPKQNRLPWIRSSYEVRRCVVGGIAEPRGKFTDFWGCCYGVRSRGIFLVRDMKVGLESKLEAGLFTRLFTSRRPRKVSISGQQKALNKV